MSDLTRIMTLVELMRAKDSEVAELEERLKKAKAELLTLERVDIPELMAEIGLSELKTSDGAVLSIKEEVDAKISEANRAAAMEWLVAHNFSGLIKTGVTVTFSRGDHEGAEALAQKLSGEYPAVEVKEDVHPGTLKAFVKEQLAAGTALPFDLFGIFPYSKAVIKEKRA